MTKITKGAVVLGAFLLVFTFQNCSGNDLPQEAQIYVAQSTSPLKLVSPLSAMGPSSTMILQASGGTPPYKFSVLSGPVTVDADSGTITSAVTGGAVSARVKDAADNTSEATFNVDMSLAQVIAQSPEFVTSGTSPLAQTFTVPVYHSITIEVWGGGGGGAGISAMSGTSFGGADGVDGAASTVTGGVVNLSALGGRKGTRCNVDPNLGSNAGLGGAVGTSGNVTNLAGGNGANATLNGNNFTASVGGNGANGGAGGQSTKAGAIPGGGGGSIYYFQSDYGGCAAGAGGGGAYSKSTYTDLNVLPVGTILNLSVGNGGAASPSSLTNNGQPVKPGAGGSGKIKITVN